MHIAVCLSGQPKNALKAYNNIYKYIIEPNNADVFMHMNYDKDNRYMEKVHINKGNCIADNNIDIKLIELYKPKAVLIEKQHNFSKSNLKIPPGRIERSKFMNKNINMSDSEHKQYIIRCLMSSFYGIFKSNELKENYANKNNIVYDYVIRLRYDSLPNQTLNCINYNPNFIYYQNLQHPDELISDWFNFGSNMIMNIYSSIYLNLEYLNSFEFFKQCKRLPNTVEPSDECSGLYEHMIRDIMTLYNIPKKSIDIKLVLA